MTGSTAQGSRRPSPIGLTGSTFVRRLAALDDVRLPAPSDAFAQRLTRWFDWTDAIALSAALSDARARTPDTGSTAAPSGTSADERECARVRAGLAKLVAGARPAPVEPRRNGRSSSATVTAPAEDGDDFAPHREHYLDCQQAMDARIGDLRQRLRRSLAATSDARAELAAVDAVLEQVVGGREHALLATVPARLERRFERLRQARLAAPDAAADPAPDAFRRELHDLLLAELEFRFQPVEGLLAALRRTSSHTDE